MSIVEHVNEDVLESYAMRRLSEAEAEAVEDHIALCSHCLDRLDETTAYIEGMRHALVPSAATALKPKVPRWLQRGWTMPVWGGAALAAAGLIFVMLRPGTLPAPATVVLDGTRGIATEVHGTGPFDFELFVPTDGQSGEKTYHVELVDGGGGKQWEGDVSGKAGQIHAIVKRKIAEGQYFLEVAEPVSGVRREYAVRIAK